MGASAVGAYLTTVESTTVEANERGLARGQYQAKIDAIVDQAQRVGNNAEGAWFCTL